MKSKLAGIHQSDIARKGKVSTTHVARVIAGLSTSARIEEMIAMAIDKPATAVFSKRRKCDGTKNLEKRLVR